MQNRFPLLLHINVIISFLKYIKVDFMKNIFAFFLLSLCIQLSSQHKDSGFHLREVGPEGMIICPIGEHSSNLYLPPESDRIINTNRKTGVFQDSLYPSVLPEYIPAIDFVLDFLENYFTSEVPVNVHIEVDQLGGSALAGARAAFMVENFEYAPLKDTEYPIALAEKILGKEINRSDQPDIVVTINSDFESWFLEPNNPTAVRPNQIDLASVLTHEVIHGLGFSAGNFVDPDSGQGIFFSAFGNGNPAAFARNVENGAGQVLLENFENGSLEMTEQFTSNNLRYNSESFKERPVKPELFAPSQYAQGSSISHLGERYNGTSNTLMTFSFAGGEVIYFPGDLTLDMLYDMGWDATRIIYEPGVFTEDVNEAYVITADVEADSGFNPSTFMLHFSTDNFVTMDSIIPMIFDETTQQYQATLPTPGTSIEYQYYFEVVDGRGIKRTRPGGGPLHFFRYNYGTDEEAPTVTDPNEVVVISTFNSFPVNVTAIDSFSGVSSVSAIVQINGAADTISLNQSELSNGEFFFGTYTFERTFEPSDIIEYKFMAVDNSTAANTTIFPSDSFLQGLYLVDTIPPTLAHEPVISVTNFDKSFKISVSTFDEFTGINEMYGVVTLNGGIPDTIQLTFAPTLFGDFYEGTFSFDEEFNPDDDIQYSIFGTDRAFVPNKSVLPEGGSTYTVGIIAIPEPVEGYFNDFNSATQDFNGSGFRIGDVGGFPNAVIQSADHPYPEGGPGQVVDFTYELVTPIIVAETESLIEFDEIALVEFGENNARWPSDRFYDYVIVEARKLRGTEYFPLLDGYDCSTYSDWRDRYESGLNSQGISSATPTQDLLKDRIIDIQDNGDFVPGDTILVRFRLFSDNAAAGWGWLIDNLKIQNESTSVDDFVSNTTVTLFPNPVKDGILTVALDMEKSYDESYITIFDFGGTMIRRLRPGTIAGKSSLQVNVQDLLPGIYLCEISSGNGSSITKKFVIGQ